MTHHRFPVIILIDFCQQIHPIDMWSSRKPACGWGGTRFQRKAIKTIFRSREASKHQEFPRFAENNHQHELEHAVGGDPTGQEELDAKKERNIRQQLSSQITQDQNHTAISIMVKESSVSSDFSKKDPALPSTSIQPTRGRHQHETEKKLSNDFEIELDPFTTVVLSQLQFLKIRIKISMDIEQVYLAVTTSGKLKVSEYVHNINILSVFFAECSPKTFTLLFWERSIFKYLWNCREESLTFGGKYQI